MICYKDSLFLYTLFGCREFVGKGYILKNFDWSFSDKNETKYSGLHFLHNQTWVKNYYSIPVVVLLRFDLKCAWSVYSVHTCSVFLMRKWRGKKKNIEMWGILLIWIKHKLHFLLLIKKKKGRKSDFFCVFVKINYDYHVLESQLRVLLIINDS